MNSILILALMALPAPAQIVGGEFETRYRIDGGSFGVGLGDSVAGVGDLDFDGFDDFLVGAPGDGPGGIGSLGSAFAYSGATGLELFRFDGTAIGDYLGNAVCGAGDVDGDGVPDLIVGAFGTDSGGFTDAGSALVYSGSDGGLLFRFDGTDSGDALGGSVAGAGDVDGDGFADLIVGAEFANPALLTDAGSAWIYSGASGLELFRIDGAVAGDRLGISVAGAGDVDGDGFDDVIVGASGAAPGGVASAGSAYVYSGASGLLIHQFDGSPTTLLTGNSVARAGDLDHDGFADLIVGAISSSPGGKLGAGSTMVYSGASGALMYRFDGRSAGDNLGESVAGAGDVNGDGTPDLIVGAASVDPGGLPFAGSAYVISGADGSLMHTFPGSARWSQLGHSVAGAGDVNGDGLADLIVGAPWDDPSGSLTVGSAYVFGLDPFLHATAREVSAATGGVIEFELDFPDAIGLDQYKILISESGTGPTTYGVDVPLTLDSMVVDTFNGIYPVPTYSDMHGGLDASGDASASLTLPAGLPASLIGNTYWLAAIANAPGSLPESCSIAIPITILP